MGEPAAGGCNSGQGVPCSDRSWVVRGRPKLSDRLREVLRSRHCSHRAEETYCRCLKRFTRFHNIRHPAEMSKPEINAFLTQPAMKGRVSASTQNEALSALLFLYRHVLNRGSEGVKIPVDDLQRGPYAH